MWFFFNCCWIGWLSWTLNVDPSRKCRFFPLFSNFLLFRWTKEWKNPRKNRKKSKTAIRHKPSATPPKKIRWKVQTPIKKVPQLWNSITRNELTSQNRWNNIHLCTVNLNPNFWQNSNFFWNFKIGF